MVRACVIQYPSFPSYFFALREGFAMGVSRRDFLKISGSTALLGTLGSGPDAEAAEEQQLRIKDAKETKTICPYCSVGCGIVVHTKDGKVVNTEGDPDHPVSEGTLCSKGASLISIINNPTRITKPRYRAAGASDWKEMEWDEALDRIAKLVKDTRDRTFVQKSKGAVVNRTEALAHIGSAALDNEECYLLQKLIRSWGLVAVEHQARI
jgi:formate dehydrogenase major subunit